MLVFLQKKKVNNLHLNETLEEESRRLNKSQLEQLKSARSSSFIEKVVNFLEETVGLKSENLSEHKQQLLSAGFFGESPLIIYAALRAVVPIIFLIGSGLYSLTFTDDLMQRLLITMIGTVIGYYTPSYILKKIIQNRSEKIFSQFPNILDLLIIQTRAGITINTAMNKVIDSMSDRYKETCKELEIFDHEIKFLPKKAQAYENLRQRMKTVDIMVNFSRVLEQSDKQGSAISDGLATLATSSRSEYMLKAEQKAAKIPVIINIPLVLFILPTMFIFIMTPIIIKAAEALSGSPIFN